mmetsp:Transcript_13456/g.56931  ORF Transcript_13456/g.56931 Transcript_13456/m.56931 type:complete len:283 (-) Transcript_13456:184-1032(-)
MHRSVSVRTHRSRPPFAGAPPPSSPTPTPRLQAKRNNASTTNRLLARHSTPRTPPGTNDAASVASTCPTLSDTLSPPTPHKSLWRRVPSLCVATTSAFRASATAADAARSPRDRSYTLRSRHPSSAKASPPRPSSSSSSRDVSASRASRTARARNGSRTRTVISLCASALRSCAPRSSVWSSRFRVALIAADEAALDASASSRLLAFDNASSADTNRRGASRSMNARVRSPTIRRNLSASSVIGVSPRSPSRKCASGVVSAKIKPHARDASRRASPWEDETA